jgi:hypothetical protein
MVAPSGWDAGPTQSFTPSGWGVTINLQWWYHYATADESGTYAFTSPSAGGGGGYAARVSGGPTSGNPFGGITAVGASNSSSGSVSLPATTASTDSLGLIGALAGGPFSSAPTGFSVQGSAVDGDGDWILLASGGESAGSVPSVNIATSGDYVFAHLVGLSAVSTAPVTGTSSFTMPKLTIRNQIPGRFLRGKSGNHFTDQNGNPYFLRGDSAWLLPANVTTLGDAQTYFQTRADQGFNFAVVRVPAGTDNTNETGADGSTADGIDPFVGEDITQLNATYWARMHDFLSAAAEAGVTVLVFVATPWGLMGRIASAGNTAAQAYGAAVAAKFSDLPNIVWAIGEDYNATDRGNWDSAMTAVYNGIRSVDPASPWMIETDITDASTRIGLTSDSATWSPRAVGEWVYYYGATYKAMRAALVAGSGNPSFLGETNYEGENNEGGPSTTNLTLRRQVGWTITNGGSGYIYGSGSVWPFGASWKTALSTTAVSHTKAMLDAFVSLPGWHKVAADTGNVFLTSGQGTDLASGSQNNGVVDPLESDYATAAVAGDGSAAVIYLPTSRAITIDTSKLGTGMTAQKVDPTTGTATALTVSSGSIAAPGNNAAGDSDWLYLFTATPFATAGTASISLAAPSISGSAGIKVNGASLVTLGALSAGASGASITPGAGTVGLPTPLASVSGSLRTTGTAASTLGRPSFSVTSSGIVIAIAQVALRAPSAGASGSVKTVGSVAIGLSRPIALLTGAVHAPNLRIGGVPVSAVYLNGVRIDVFR